MKHLRFACAIVLAVVWISSPALSKTQCSSLGDIRNVEGGAELANYLRNVEIEDAKIWIKIHNLNVRDLDGATLAEYVFGGAESLTIDGVGQIKLYSFLFEELRLSANFFAQEKKGSAVACVPPKFSEFCSLVGDRSGNQFIGYANKILKAAGANHVGVLNYMLYDCMLQVDSHSAFFVTPVILDLLDRGARPDQWAQRGVGPDGKQDATILLVKAIRSRNIRLIDVFLSAGFDVNRDTGKTIFANLYDTPSNSGPVSVAVAEHILQSGRVSRAVIKKAWSEASSAGNKPLAQKLFEHL